MARVKREAWAQIKAQGLAMVKDQELVRVKTATPAAGRGSQATGDLVAAREIILTVNLAYCGAVKWSNALGCCLSRNLSTPKRQDEIKSRVPSFFGSCFQV
jgi:hypothetical protein